MKNKKFRQLLAQPGIIRAPGAYDAWSARCIAGAGFPAVYMTGYGVSASVLGRPDIGFASMTEMAAMARNMCETIDVPLIADADNGYGGVLNMVRTIREYELAGVSAIQIEDQVMPKRCGHMEGKELVGAEEMVAKIRAAIHARRDPDCAIIARTDARAVIGFDEAIRRAHMYADAGADVIFVEAPQSVDELKEIAGQIKKPLLANMVEKGKTPVLTARELEELGYKIVIFPVTALYAVSKALNDLFAEMKANDTSAKSFDRLIPFPDFNKAIGLDTWRDLEAGFSKV